MIFGNLSSGSVLAPNVGWSGVQRKAVLAMIQVIGARTEDVFSTPPEVCRCIRLANLRWILFQLPALSGVSGFEMAGMSRSFDSLPVCETRS